jgi:hypothetical protein
MFSAAGVGIASPVANVCRADAAAALTGSRGLLRQELQSAKGTLIALMIVLGVSGEG